MRTIGKRSIGILAATALLAISALPALAADNAQLRVLHASPDAPAVDIWINDAVVDGLTDVPFGTLSGYLEVPAGDYNVKVFAAGTDTDPVIDADVTLASGKAYTAAAIGELASITAAVFEDGGMAAADKAMARVIHLSPDAPAVDVAPDGADPADAVVKGLEFPDATDYLSLDAGSYDLEVRLAGTTDVALQLDPVDLEAGMAYSIFAIGSAAADPMDDNALQVLIGIDPTMLPDTAMGGQEMAAAGAPILLIAGLLGAAAFALTLVSRRRVEVTTR
jgi:hypothetical protein